MTELSIEARIAQKRRERDDAAQDARDALENYFDTETPTSRARWQMELDAALHRQKNAQFQLGDLLVQAEEVGS